MERFKIKHNFSTPYHPQTNGLVERFNRTLCEALAKTAEETTEWDLYIPPVLFAYRTSKQASTKVEPFFLVYGRPPKLPIDQLVDEEPLALNNRIEQLIDDLPHVREEARLQINKSQQKQKQLHDNKLRKVSSFKIGDKVLYFNAAKEKSWSGKLDPKWKGPYYIHQVLLNGSYKLRNMNGRVLVTPANGTLLKLYNDRQNWEPIVVIEN